MDDPVLGPPTRPVCGGSAAYSNKLSYFLGLFLRPVWQEKETTCLSTEEMLASMEEVNNSGDLDDDCIVGIENYGTVDHLAAFNGETEEWEEEVADFDSPRDLLTAATLVEDTTELKKFCN